MRMSRMDSSPIETEEKVAEKEPRRSPTQRASSLVEKRDTSRLKMERLSIIHTTPRTLV